MTKNGRQNNDYIPESLRRHVDSHFTREQLAAAFGCDEETISRWVDKGQLPRPIPYGLRHVWTLESLEAHRRQRTLRAQEDTGRIAGLSRFPRTAGRAS